MSSRPTWRWKCVGCGCSDFSACKGGCFWVKKDLCSRCASTPELEAYVKRHRHTGGRGLTGKLNLNTLLKKLEHLSKPKIRRK